MNRLFSVIILSIFLAATHSISIQAASLDEGATDNSSPSSPQSTVKGKTPLTWKSLNENISDRAKKKLKSGGAPVTWFDEKKSEEKILKKRAPQTRLVKKNSPDNPGFSAGSPDNTIEINRQLQNIIKINDTLKVNQAPQIVQLQAIQEQAKIHQQILRQIELSKTSMPVFKPGDVQEVLRQEKIRLISEQTSRNSEIVKLLAQQRRS